jgi:hypothetical protein
MNAICLCLYVYIHMCVCVCTYVTITNNNRATIVTLNPVYSQHKTVLYTHRTERTCKQIANFSLPVNRHSPPHNTAVSVGYSLRLTVCIKQQKALRYISLCYTVGISVGFVWNCVCVELLKVMVDVRMIVSNEAVRRIRNLYWVTVCYRSRSC